MKALLLLLLLTGSPADQGCRRQCDVGFDVTVRIMEGLHDAANAGKFVVHRISKTIVSCTGMV